MQGQGASKRGGAHSERGGAHSERGGAQVKGAGLAAESEAGGHSHQLLLPGQKEPAIPKDRR